jgi:hypothetical protein
MPFAKKFRAMMDLPFPGDTLGDLTVESVDVRDIHGGGEGYAYGVQMVLRGPGGVQGVRRALKPLFAQHPTTFSGYGNPYQLRFGKAEIVSLGDRRYQVTARGLGARVYLAPELARWTEYLVSNGLLAAPLEPAAQDALIEDYLERYKAEIRQLVARYQHKLAAGERDAQPDADEDAG